MAGPLAAPLVGLAGNILGGLFGRSKPKYVVPDYAKIRERAEAAGLNPLTALQSAPGAVMEGGNSYLGQAIADGAMMLADSMSKQSGTGRLEQAQAENADLKKQVQQLTLRPEVGGVYARRQATPTLREALGGPDDRAPDTADNPAQSRVRHSGGAGTAPSASGLDPLLDVDPIDPRRVVENKPTPTSPGAMVVDNPYLGRYYFPTIDGDEPVDLLDLPSMAAAIPQMGYHFGQYMAEGGTATGAMRQRQRDAKAKGQEYLLSRKKPRRRPAAEYYTHPQTGFSAQRYYLGR